MICRSLAFLLISFIVVLGAEAQPQTPGAKGESRTFSMLFDGEGGYLGVQSEEVTRDNFGKYGLTEVRGVAIDKVLKGSPAEKAGLQSGDVIVRFNDEEVTSMRKLARLLSEVSPDRQVRLAVVRGGAEREMTATLGKRPMPRFEEGGFGTYMPRTQRVPFPPGEFPSMPGIEGFPRVEAVPPGAPGPSFFLRGGAGRRIGVSVTTLTKQLSEYFGVTSGVIINEVRENSPAAKAGLKAGDIIIEVDGREVKGEIDLIRAIAEKKEGDVTLTIVRDRHRQTIRVTPEEVTDGLNAFYVLPVPAQPGPDAPPISWPRNSGSLFRAVKVSGPNILGNVFFAYFASWRENLFTQSLRDRKIVTRPYPALNYFSASR